MKDKFHTMQLYAIALKGVGVISGTASHGRNLAIHNMRLSLTHPYTWKELKRDGYYVVSGTFRYQP